MNQSKPLLAQSPWFERLAKQRGEVTFWEPSGGWVVGVLATWVMAFLVPSVQPTLLEAEDWFSRRNVGSGTRLSRFGAERGLAEPLGLWGN